MNEFDERIKQWRDEFEGKYGRKPSVTEFTEAKQRIKSEIDSIKKNMQNSQRPNRPQKRNGPG